MWNSKLLTKLSAIGAAFFGFVAWLATVPPEQQSGMLGALNSVLPQPWAPTIGLWSKFLTTGLAYYAVYKAAHSGPQTPPQNPPSE